MKRLIAICTLLLVLFVPCRSIFTDVTDQVVSVLAAENDQNVKVTVDRVVDGDTFVTYIDGQKKAKKAKKGFWKDGYYAAFPRR